MLFDQTDTVLMQQTVYQNFNEFSQTRHGILKQAYRNTI